jgi:hypothetical protein
MSTAFQYVLQMFTVITLRYLRKTPQAELRLVQTLNNSGYCKGMPKSGSKSLVFCLKFQ